MGQKNAQVTTQFDGVKPLVIQLANQPGVVEPQDIRHNLVRRHSRWDECFQLHCHDPETHKHLLLYLLTPTTDSLVVASCVKRKRLVRY
jgi:hypothetical protein